MNTRLAVALLAIVAACVLAGTSSAAPSTVRVVHRGQLVSLSHTFPPTTTTYCVAAVQYLDDSLQQTGAKRVSARAGVVRDPDSPERDSRRRPLVDSLRPGLADDRDLARRPSRPRAVRRRLPWPRGRPALVSPDARPPGLGIGRGRRGPRHRGSRRLRPEYRAHDGDPDRPDEARAAVSRAEDRDRDRRAEGGGRADAGACSSRARSRARTSASRGRSRRPG